MRNHEQLRERIRMALAEDMNVLPSIMKEPENQLPEFLERLTNHLYEVCVDEITFRRK